GAGVATQIRQSLQRPGDGLYRDAVGAGVWKTRGDRGFVCSSWSERRLLGNWWRLSTAGQSWVVTTRGRRVGAACNIRRRRNVFPLASSHLMKDRAVMCWDRGRPARNERVARKRTGFHCQMTALLRRVCGRDARGPSTSLDWLPKTERQEAFRPPAWCLLPTAYSFTFPFPNSRCIRVV